MLYEASGAGKQKVKKKKINIGEKRTDDKMFFAEVRHCYFNQTDFTI